MYDFEDKGGRHIALRPEMTASVVRAFIQHRPPCRGRPGTSGSNFRYESPQAGPLPGVPPGRHRGVRQRRPRPRRRGHRPRMGLLRRPRAAPGRAARSTRSATTPAGPPTGSPAPSTCEAAPDGALRRAPGPPRRQPAAGPRLQEARVRGRHRRTPPGSSTTCATPARPTSARVKAGLEPLGIPYRIDSRLVRGLDYYTRTTFEYVGRWPGVGPERRRRRRSLRRPGRGDGRTVHPGHRLRPRRGADPAGLRRRGRAAGDRAPVRSTSSSSTSPAATAARDLTVAAPGRRAPRRPGLRRPLTEGPVQGGRPLRGPSGPGGRPGRGRRRHRVDQGPAGRCRRRTGHRRRHGPG